MAEQIKRKLRVVDVHFWDDPYVEGLDPIEKLLFLFLLTNSACNLLGIYEISLRRIAFDTGIDKDKVIKSLARFEADGKIYYCNEYIIISYNILSFYKGFGKTGIENKLNKLDEN